MSSLKVRGRPRNLSTIEGRPSSKWNDIMTWIYLIVAGLLEIGWAIGIKFTDGWTRLWPSVITLVLMIISFYFLSLAVRDLPIGTAYAVWTGMGAVGTALLGMALFGEPRTALRFACIILILGGITGLKLTTS
jgi:quaternary ammonium compound-resistance protein SugE